MSANNQPSSLSDKVRQYILEVHKNDSKYFETATDRERVKDFSIFCSKHQADGFNFALHRNLLITQIRKLAPELGIDLTKLGVKSKLDKHRVTRGTQTGNIKVNPKDVKHIPQEPRYDAKTGKLIQPVNSSQARPQQTVFDTKTGLPIPQQQIQNKQGEAMHPVGCQCFKCMQSQGIYQPMDDETAGAPFEVLADIWHAKNPNFRLLSRDETRRLGKAWAPIFSRYVGGDILFFLAPVIVTAQCFMGRAMETRAPKKDPIKKKQDTANEKTSKDSKQVRDYYDDASPDSNESEVKRKFFSNKKVQAIRDEGKDEDE